MMHHTFSKGNPSGLQAAQSSVHILGLWSYAVGSHSEWGLPSHCWNNRGPSGKILWLDGLSKNNNMHVSQCVRLRQAIHLNFYLTLEYIFDPTSGIQDLNSTWKNMRKQPKQNTVVSFKQFEPSTDWSWGHWGTSTFSSCLRFPSGSRKVYILNLQQTTETFK